MACEKKDTNFGPSVAQQCWEAHGRNRDSKTKKEQQLLWPDQNNRAQTLSPSHPALNLGSYAWKKYIFQNALVQLKHLQHLKLPALKMGAGTRVEISAPKGLERFWISLSLGLWSTLEPGTGVHGAPLSRALQKRHRLHNLCRGVSLCLGDTQPHVTAEVTQQLYL